MQTQRMHVRGDTFPIPHGRDRDMCVVQILMPLGVDLKQRVLQSVARELRDLGLSVDTFK